MSGGIRVINRHRDTARLPEVLIPVGRPNVLGNPFPMKRGLAREFNRERDKAVNRFEGWLRQKLTYDNDVRREIYRLADLVQSGVHLALECTCAPLRCHADVIKKVIEEILLERSNASRTPHQCPAA